MAFKDWFSRRTPLQLALERGTQPGADLAEQLRKLGDYSIKSEADAEAVCRVLERLLPAGSAVGGESGFHALVGLFQDVDGSECPAFGVMAEKGIGLLVQIVDDALQEPSDRDADDLLFALKILAMYGTPEGTDTVLRAAQKPLQPDAYLWSLILSAYSAGHPEHERLFKQLSDPLPTDFLAVALLDSACAALRGGADCPHPFDSTAGKERLERWLTDGDEEHFSYAVSATAAIPFLSAPERDALLALAFDHPSTDVQLEAAWAAAKLRRDAGIKWLARSCLDVNVAERAKHYLTELGRPDAIPPEAGDAGFQARAEFAQWLAHPNELGRAPDQLEIVDHRELNWPPERESRQMWLIRYCLKDSTGLKTDDVGVGLVGSVTFCLFTYKLEQRPPEDCYAIHCYWEMEGRGLIAESDVEEDSTEYDQMLRQGNVDGLGEARIVCVVELSSPLEYPQKLVALAKATRHAEAGWMVLDGGRSRWYAADELPADVPDRTVVMVHVGRVLLGFNNEPDRRKFLHSAAPPREPEQIIAAYEGLVDKARTSPKQAKKLLGRHSILGSAFADYVAALSALRSQSRAACTCTAYESLLAIAAQADPSFHGELFDSFSPLGDAFDSYVDALIESNRQAEVPALLEKFQPHWDHNLGYGKLGGAAFKSGHDQLAETFFVTLRHSLKDWCRCEEIGFLAEIWNKEGRFEEAQTLLIDALKGLHDQRRTATGSDRKLFEEWFQQRRASYLRLFPERGDDELRRHGIPSSTLDRSAP
jgi:hypothetical protein